MQQELSHTIEARVLACTDKVRAMACRYARESGLDVDDLYSIGMLAVCEYAGKQLSGDAIGYLIIAAKHDMLDELARSCRISLVSLDAPLSSASDITLGDILSSTSIMSSQNGKNKRTQALYGAIRRLTSSRQRAAIRRRFGLPGYGKHSTAETANALRISISAINHLQFRGVRALACDSRLCKVMGV